MNLQQWSKKEFEKVIDAYLEYLLEMDKETCLRLEYMTLMQKAYQPDKESLLECHVRIFRYYCEREFPPPHYHIDPKNVCKPC